MSSTHFDEWGGLGYGLGDRLRRGGLGGGLGYGLSEIMRCLGDGGGLG
jgi:hypothetical protein